MQVTLGGLYGSPDLHLFALEGDQAAFLTMDAAAYRRSIFLDARISPTTTQMLKLPLQPLHQFAETRGIWPQRAGWIFHVAQCGSTLLARMLDRDGGNLVLREPGPLRQVAVEGAGKPDAPALRARLRLAATMASRRYRADLPTIVKATVPVNFILPQLMAQDAIGPAIFLYFPLDLYLFAILRSPGHRQWVQRVTGELAGVLGVAPGEWAALDDAQRAAALWSAQIRAFAAAMECLPDSYSLDAETLFSNPRGTGAAASALFGKPLTETELDSTVQGDLFSTYSKNPSVAFDNAARLARQAEMARELAPEVARARAWLMPRLQAAPLTARLARPLVGQAPSLL
jgi:hypothetical protein